MIDNYDSIKEKLFNHESSDVGLSSEHSNIKLSWSNISLSYNPSSLCSKSKQEKKILNNIDGLVYSRETLAIIGASGSGKTSLLNLLSKKSFPSSFKSNGIIEINSKPIDKETISQLSCYVMQDDSLHPQLTPIEVLMFTASLKLNGTRKFKEQKVKDIIKDLNLNKCENTRIGNELTRGISGGERKRTSIALELLSDPKILFLDEPTTGLDSYNSFETILLINKLAKEKNKVVIFTIHQPSSEIFQLIDKINILALGRNIYFGQKDMALNHFESLGFTVRNNYNPFEFFIEMTNITVVEDQKVISLIPELLKYNEDESEQKYEFFVDKIAAKFEKKLVDFIDELKERKLSEFTFTKKKSTTFIHECIILMKRNIINALRNKLVLLSNFMTVFILSIIISALYYEVSFNASGIYDRAGLFFIITTLCIFFQVTTTILNFSDERRTLAREQNSNTYSITAYYFSYFISAIPLIIIIYGFFVGIIYFFVRLNYLTSSTYFSFMGYVMLLSFYGTSWGYFLGSLSKNLTTLTSLFPLTTAPLTILSGFFANSQNYAPWMKVIQWISPFKYGFQILIDNEFTQAPPLYCVNTMNIQCQPFQVYNFNGKANRDLIILGGMSLAVIVIGIVSLRRLLK